MLKCPRCKRITDKEEPTAKFTTYCYIKNLETGKVTKQIHSEINVCFNCRGVRLEK